MSTSLNPVTGTTPHILSNPFIFSTHEVRTAVDEKGLIWFCGRDVAACFDVTWGSNTLRTMPPEWTCVLRCSMETGAQDVSFMSEPGLYRFIFRSNKPKATQFTNWICEEVLPSIRKQGFYGKVTPTDRLAYSIQVVAIAEKLVEAKDAMLHKTLSRELRDLCNLLGNPMPDLTLLGKPLKQLGLPGV